MKREIVLTALLVGCAGVVAASDAPAPSDWTTMLPMVQVAVRHEFPKIVAQAHYPASITKTFDVAPGVQMALVDLGTGGYAEEMTVMRLEGNTPVAARFKERDEKVVVKMFLSGTTENEGGALNVVPADHALFAGHWEKKGKKTNCGGEAYQWDEKAKNFGYAKKLTKQMAKEYCQQVAKK